jgi:hypothetical protein
MGIIYRPFSCPRLYLPAAPSSQSRQDIGSVRVKGWIVWLIYKGLENLPQNIQNRTIDL